MKWKQRCERMQTLGYCIKIPVCIYRTQKILAFFFCQVVLCIKSNNGHFCDLDSWIHNWLVFTSAKTSLIVTCGAVCRVYWWSKELVWLRSLLFGGFWWWGNGQHLFFFFYLNLIFVLICLESVLTSSVWNGHFAWLKSLNKTQKTC